MLIRNLARAGVALVALNACGPTTADHSASDETPSSCALSSRRFKEDIAYLSPEQLDELTEQVMSLHLATFRYKQGGTARHLGYILEDTPEAAASDVEHQRVDLYAYTSMAVAALQVQARDLRQLEVDVDALTWQVEKLSHRQERPVSKASRKGVGASQAQAALDEVSADSEW